MEKTAKNFWMNVPFMYNFRSFSNKFPTIFWSLTFHILLHTTTYTFLNHSTDCTIQRFKIAKEEMEQLVKLLNTKASSKCRIPGINSKKTTFCPQPRPLQSLLMFDGAFAKKPWELVDVWWYICEKKTLKLLHIKII